MSKPRLSEAFLFRERKRIKARRRRTNEQNRIANRIRRSRRREILAKASRTRNRR